VIQGFTDNEPLARRFPNNWDLAAACAIAVVHYLEAQGVDPNQLSGVTFGQSHPIASNDRAASRGRNRRINIDISGPGPVGETSLFSPHFRTKVQLRS